MNGSKMGGGDKLGNFLFLFYFFNFFGGGETLFKKMVHCTQKYLHIPYFLPIFVGGGLFLKNGGVKTFLG